MDITARLTPIYYKLLSISVERDGDGEVVVNADVGIFNAAGQRIVTDNPSIALSVTEKQVLQQFVTDKMQMYEVAVNLQPLPTGLSEPT